MVQRHSIILWKKADSEHRKFEEISKETYDFLSLFQSYPENLKPNYLTVNAKNQIRNFDWNYGNFRDVLKKGVNQEGKNVFEDLGYSISFFSSMDENNSCAFQMTVGNRNDRFYNTFILNLPLSLNLYDKETADMIKTMFEKLVLAYRPFWGCVSNKILSRKYGQYLHGNMPTTVHWLNYWSEEIIQEIGVEKINELLAHNTSISFQNGVLSIKETAINTDKEEDIILHEKLQNYFFE